MPRSRFCRQGRGQHSGHVAKSTVSGNDLTYDVILLEGSLPENAGACSLFIDIIGCPLTPMSFAGAARRGAFFRGAYYGGGDYGPALYDSSGSIRGPNGSANWGNGSGTATGGEAIPLPGIETGNSSRHRTMKKFKEEFLKILPPTIFFFVALHLVMFIRVLMLKGTALSTSSSISIAVACPYSRQSCADRGHGADDQSLSQ